MSVIWHHQFGNLRIPAPIRSYQHTWLQMDRAVPLFDLQETVTRSYRISRTEYSSQARLKLPNQSKTEAMT